MGKKVPMRQCLGCREMKPKNELIRIAKSPDGEISLDDTGKKPGRGAYLCNDLNCFKRIIKSNALARAFKTKIPDNIINELQRSYESNKHKDI
ncbi:MAG: YlxR family protein [Oscillospiraceae bacterium]|nr:YlxR family protein [Oscillospiraceae bacterium]